MLTALTLDGCYNGTQFKATDEQGKVWRSWLPRSGHWQLLTRNPCPCSRTRAAPPRRRCLGLPLLLPIQQSAAHNCSSLCQISQKTLQQRLRSERVEGRSVAVWSVCPASSSIRRFDWRGQKVNMKLFSGHKDLGKPRFCSGGRPFLLRGIPPLVLMFHTKHASNLTARNSGMT